MVNQAVAQSGQGGYYRLASYAETDDIRVTGRRSE
ncbi:hypothetical protein ACVIVC_005424 [Sinorhizobium meliloti]